MYYVPALLSEYQAGPPTLLILYSNSHTVILHIRSYQGVWHLPLVKCNAPTIKFDGEFKHRMPRNTRKFKIFEKENRRYQGKKEQAGVGY